MAKLAHKVQVFIVQRLALFDSPQQVADAVKEEYKITIPRQQVENYDPEKRPTITKEWRALHAATREAFLKESAKEPAAHRAVRVRRLARMAERAEDRRNYPLAASLYEQIAKEIGEAYTNRRVLVPGDPLNELAKTLGCTPEQLTALISAEEDTPAGDAHGDTTGDATGDAP